MGNKFDIKVLTGMKSFNVKGERTMAFFFIVLLLLHFDVIGTQTGNQFQGTIYSNEDKEVMTTTGTFIVDNNGFKLDSQLVDISSRKVVLILKTDIKPNRGQGLTTDIDLTTPDKTRSFKIHCKF